MGRSFQAPILPQSPLSDSDHEEGGVNANADVELSPKQKIQRRIKRSHKKKKRFQLSPLKDVQVPEYRLVQDLLNLSNWRLGSKATDPASSLAESGPRVLNDILCFWNAFAGKIEEMEALIKVRQLRIRRARSRMHGMRFMCDILRAGSCSEQWNIEQMSNERPVVALLAMESGKLLHTFARVGVLYLMNHCFSKMYTITHFVCSPEFVCHSCHCNKQRMFAPYNLSFGSGGAIPYSRCGGVRTRFRA